MVASVDRLVGVCEREVLNGEINRSDEGEFVGNLIFPDVNESFVDLLGLIP